MIIYSLLSSLKGKGREERRGGGGEKGGKKDKRKRETGGQHADLLSHILISQALTSDKHLKGVISLVLVLKLPINAKNKYLFIIQSPFYHFQSLDEGAVIWPWK